MPKIKQHSLMRERPSTSSFLFPHSFTCPIDLCGVRYSGVSWTSRRQSLVRHLLDEHEIKVKVTYTCTLCSTTGLGLHSTRHPCFAREGHELSPLDFYRHKCPECPVTLTSRKGLDNHMRKHRRAQAQETTQQPMTTRTTSTAPAATPTGRPRRATASNRAPRTMTLRSSQSSNSSTSTGSSPSENSTTVSTTPDTPTPPEWALTPFSPPLGDLPELPDEDSATTGNPPPTPSEVSTARRRSSCASLFSQDDNAASIPPGPRQHESPHSDTDHDSPRHFRPPSAERALTPLPPILGSIADSNATTPSIASEEESPPEGSQCSSRIQQDPDTARASPGTSEQRAPQHNMVMTQQDPSPRPSARSITCSVDSPTQPTLSEGTLLDDAGGESQDPAPQTENPGEITLSEPIDDTSVLAEHTQQIRQLLREPATAERWDDFLSILEEAVSVVRREAKISDNPAGGKPRVPTNPNNAQQIQGLYRRNRRRAIRVIKQGETKLCEIPLDRLEQHFAETWAPKEGNTHLLLNKALTLSLAANFNAHQNGVNTRPPGEGESLYV
ncbi:hypothetical protein MRX96_018151 [Rhipicephalus microplus]